MGANRWLLHLLIAIDQFVNALLGGWPDETLSARSHRKNDIWRTVINAIFFWQYDHCAKAYWSERARKQLPEQYREG
jgi:hypothetical protein